MNLFALRPKLLAFARKRMGYDHPDAEDMVSSAMLKAWENRSSYQELPGKTLSAWVTTILRNEILNHWQRERGRILSPIEETGEIGNQEITIEVERVSQAMQALDQGDCETLRLAALGATSPEIARIFGIGELAARSRLRRAREKLTAQLFQSSHDTTNLEIIL